MDEKRLFQLFNAKTDGSIEPADHEELQKALKDSADARELWFLHQDVDAGLASFAEEPAKEQPPGRKKWFIPAMIAAALALAGPWVLMGINKPRIIAELTSSENAAWESSLPTDPGAKLSRGYMKLTNGIATIQFRSGAELTIEAPAMLEIESPMKANLMAGTAVVNVPESAVGFIVETPQGHVVDHGTAFAVSVKKHKDRSDIDVIEGEVSLHTPKAGNEVRLKEAQGASIYSNEIVRRDDPHEEADIAATTQTVRVSTKGRSYSVIGSNTPKWLHPELLLVKRKKKEGNFERRSFFAFDISRIDLAQVETASIRLVQVPSGIGYAARLPKISRIGVYGMTNQAKADWQPGTTWQEGPAPGDGIKLGDIEIPRSEQSGSRIFQSNALLNFLKSNPLKSVTFILERETADLKGDVPSLVHAFAGDLHPNAVGPTLEFTLKQ